MPGLQRFWLLGRNKEMLRTKARRGKNVAMVAGHKVEGRATISSPNL